MEVLQRRALGALFVVPPLVIAVILGEPWIAVLVTAIVALAAVEVLRLLRGAGYPTQLALGVVLAVVVSLAIGVAFRADVDPSLAEVTTMSGGSSRFSSCVRSAQAIACRASSWISGR